MGCRPRLVYESDGLGCRGSIEISFGVTKVLHSHCSNLQMLVAFSYLLQRKAVYKFHSCTDG